MARRRLRGRDLRARLDTLARRAAARVLGAPGADPSRGARTAVRVLSVVARDRWRWFRLRPMRDVPAREQGLVRGAGAGLSLGPRFAHEPPGAAEERHVRREFPAVHYRRFRDALVDERASSVLVGTDHVLPDHAFDLLSESRLKGGSLLHHGSTVALHRSPRQLPDVERAVHLGGYHAYNWYHWVAEIVPRVLAIPDLPPHLQDHPLLVPSSAAGSGTAREVLEALLPQREILAFPSRGPVLVRDLVVLDGLVLHPAGFGQGGGPRVGRELIHVEGMRDYRAALRAALGVSDGIEPGFRIFIDRDHDPERGYNREEILAVAERRGFTPIVGGNLTAREQAALFARAEFVIGPNGAGWANVLFCSPGARGLCWLVPEGMGGPWFRNLGHVAGVELSYLAAEPRSEGNPLKVDCHVDPQRFERALDEVIAGW